MDKDNKDNKNDKNNKTNKTNYPISQEQIAKDASLEALLFDIQYSLGELSQILRDYIYMNSESNVYPVHKKRTRDEFYTDFNNVAGSVVSKLEEMLKIFPDKKIDDYTILMKLLDENAPNDFSWFHYHLMLIKRVMEIFIKRINHWRSAKDCYENFYALEGNSSFLHDMCHDVSFLLCNLYCYNIWKYNVYTKNSQVDATKNPFTRYNTMPKMMKSHKVHSRTLLDSCEALINKTFFKDDINAVPIMTSLLRLMIEVRFEEYLGIQAIYVDENHSKIRKVVGSDYFELAELDKYAVLPIPLDAIKRIYSWASEFVHKGVSDYYWIIFFVREYLLNFILCNVYMDEDYYDNLRNKIVTLFNTTEKCVEWKEPINLRKVSHDRLDDIRTEIKNKGYEEFRKLENKREFEALEKLQEKMRMKKSCSNL